MLVLAGPGTGKTTTLVGRYLHLVNSGANPNSILCCTFTKKAADELTDRINSATNIREKTLPIGTFHALSLRILKAIGSSVGVAPDFSIWAKDWERIKVVSELLKPLIASGIYEGIDTDQKDAANVMQFLDDTREALLDPEDASIKASEQGNSASMAHSEVYASYENYLNTENKIDFPRMVQWACKALRHDTQNGGNFAKQFSHILVDEYQDINFAQKTLVELLSIGGAELWAVGDDYQAIYGWRGSDVRYILGFPKQYPNAKIVSLVRNYRSGKQIVNLANNLSDHMKERYKKDLVADRNDEGEVVFEYTNDEQGEALAVAEQVQSRTRKGVPLSEISIISRTNKLPTAIVNILLKRGVPVALRGGVAAFEEYEARLLLTAAASSSEIKLENIWALRMPPGLYGFCQKLIGESWDRRIKALTTYIAKRPPATMDESALERRKDILEFYKDYLCEFKEAADLFSVLKAAMNSDNDPNRIFVGTIHSAKGLEWDSVCVIGWDDGILPQRQNDDERAYEEERRIAYVGITRAKNFLMLTRTKKRGEWEHDASPFLGEMIHGTKSTPAATGRLQHKTHIGSGDSKSAGHYSSHDMTLNDREIWIENFGREKSLPDQATVAQRLKELRLNTNKAEQQKIADGQGGGGSGWSDQAAGTGLLAEAGYTVKKDGPDASERREILKGILSGQVHIPDWISNSVQDQWGAPNTEERLVKIRNTINVALGNQKGRRNASKQAIEKWEQDLAYLDNIERPALRK